MAEPHSSPPQPERVHYVAGFAFDGRGRVILVEKNRPTWQAGLWNAVGGKIEGTETSREAMRREFDEEAGVDWADWDHLCTYVFDGGSVRFFKATLPIAAFDDVTSRTDERIHIHNVADVVSGRVRTLPNVSWLLPLAAYNHERLEPFTVFAHDLQTASSSS